MIKMLRNKEFTRCLIMCCILSVAAVTVSAVWNKRFGVLMFIVCAVFLFIYIMETYGRYRKIAGLASDIDKILHGEQMVPIDQYAEGELAILQSEVHKMTIRLREQKQQLLDDKIYLADSLADISHQIRTPLTSINLLSSFLSEPDISDERRRKLLQEMNELLRRIDWLITALLKISKLDAGTVRFKEEHISLNELIKKAVSSVLVSIELREQTLSIRADGEFNGDIAWTCEAITNIVKNCMEHTPKGGTISVEAAENAIYSEIVITDTGSGIAKEDILHIFERFYKGKDCDKTSFGIGLALARMIITSQNGTVKAENNKNKGAKFTIRFYKGIV